MKKTALIKTLMAALAAVPMLASAANLTWDATPAVSGAQDGSGTWDTNTANWWTGAANATFNIFTPDTPTIGNSNGVAGTITLGTNINSLGIIFNAPSVGNYTIAGGGYNLILTNRTITANVSATISANIVPFLNGNSSLTLANSAANGTMGILTLSGNNSLTNFNVGGNNPNTTAAVRIGSSTAFGWGNVNMSGGQGSQTSSRIEIVTNNLTITNNITSLGRNNNSAVLVNLGTNNVMSGTQTKSTGGQDTHWQSEVANGLTFSGASSPTGIALSSSAGGPRYFVLRGSGGGTVSGSVSNTPNNAIAIVKAGSGIWTLSGFNNYTNTLTASGAILNEGTLNLDYATQNNSKLSDLNSFTLAGGILNLTNGSHTEVVASTVIGVGNSSVTRGGGTSVLRMNAITRQRGGVVDFGAASIADTDSSDVNGILGGYATVAGANWAHSTAAAADTAVTAYSGYTDIAASGSTIANSAATNVRLNSAGGGGNIALGAAVTTVNSLLQNTTTAATVDAATGILRLGAIGGVLLPSTAQSLTVGTAANSGLLTAGGADNTAGEIVLINNSANALTVNSVITNNGTGNISFTKAGSGSATLAGSNTHTGTNSIVGGTLNISSDANLGAVPGAATPSSVLINGGTLNATADTTLSANRGIALGPTSRYGNGTIGVNSGATFFVPGIVANADLTGNGPGASLTKTGAGTLVLSGANTYANGTFINAGTVSVTADNNLGGVPQCYNPENIILNGGTLLASNTFTLDTRRGVRLGPIGGSGSGTVSVADTITLTFSGVISDNWNGAGSFTKNGTGTLVLGGGLNDYVGDTTISAGILQLNNSRALPNGAGKGNLLNNGTVNLNGVNVQLNGLTGSGTVDNTTATSITLGVGNNNQGGTFGGTLQNSGGGALTLSKAGSATVTLSGAANHTGSTAVGAGTLALTGSATMGSTTNIVISSAATFSVSGLSSTFTLNSGQVISGSGTVSGAASTGTGTLAPGNLGGAGTLTNGNLTLGSGSFLNYDLANVVTIGGGVNDFAVVNGNLTIAGPVTLNLSYLNAIPASSGKYTLAKWTGSFTGTPTDITVPSGFTIVTNGAAKTLELLINHTSASLTWYGGVNNVWDINSTPNWDPASTTNFFNGDSANFDNTALTVGAINISTPVIANAVTVTGTNTFNFTGSSLAAANLVKSGSGALVLENDSLFNAALISSGTLQIGNAGTTGAISGGGITNNAALIANRTDALVITNPISGTGTLTQSGTGDLALNASNSYTGLTTINAGRLFLANAASLGSTAAGTTVASGAELFITQNVNVDNESLTLSGSGLNNLGSGALHKGGGGATTYGGAITLNANTTLNLDGNATLNLTNLAGINGAAANASLLLAGAGGGVGSIAGPLSLGTGAVTNNGGTWTVAASNNYAGNTVINGGAYRISDVKSLGTTPGAWTPARVTLNGGILQAMTGSNVVISDGRSGIALTAASVLGVDTGATLTISNEISGTGDIQKWFPGLLILNGSNSFAGVFNNDGGSTTISDGTTRIARSAALQNVTAINIRNNNGGSSTFQVDGTAASVSLPQPITLTGRNVGVVAVQNVAGTNTLSGGITIGVGGANYWIQSDAGLLNLDSTITSAAGGTRTFTFQGSGDMNIIGTLANGTATAMNVTKLGNGTLTLSGNNSHVGTNTVSAGTLLVNGSIASGNIVTVAGGTLGGNGTINSPVSVLAGGTFSPGSSIGALAIVGDVALAGTTVLEVNKTANTNDHVLITGAVTYGGTLFATNLSGTLNVGDKFTNFVATTQSGGFTNLTGSPGAGKLWSFTNGVLSVIAGVNTTPTNITTSVSGNVLTLSWPTDHLGWRLQVQTNSLSTGLNTNWSDVAGAASVNSVTNTINPANGAVFYRMIYP